jgi:ATP-dependent Clp protease ATP-binding subunit ClpA
MNIVTTGLQEPERLAPSTLEAIRLAQEEAVRMQAQAVYPEHLLLGTIAQGESKAAQMMCRCGLDMPAIRVRASEVFGSQYVEAGNGGLPTSEESLECIAWAISLVDRYNQYSLVLPEHLVLEVLRHPRMKQFLTPFSSSVELLQSYLTREIWTSLIQNAEESLLSMESLDQDVQGMDKEASPPHTLRVKRCPSCKKEALPGWKHCAYCGASLTLICPTCGAAQPEVEDARFCFECGSLLTMI